MPKDYPLYVWTRKKWQEERDKADVPKGAASKVSMGDELDKFHKAFAKGLGEGADAGKRLKTKIAAYRAAVKTKYPKWAKRVEDQLEFNLDAFLNDYEQIEAGAKTFNEAVDTVRDIWPDIKDELKTWLKEHPEPGEGEKFEHAKLKALRKALGEIGNVGQRLQFASDELPDAVWKEAKKVWYELDAGEPLDKERGRRIHKIVTEAPVI